MSAADRDAVVIGGGVSGLIAGSYLARAGLRVTLVESNPFLGGLCAPRSPPAKGPQTDLIYALDRKVVEDLRLARRLRFAVRDLPLVGLRPGDRHVVIGRNPHAAADFIRPHSGRDAQAFARFRRSLFSQARRARRLWWDGVEDTRSTPALRQLSFLSASAMLDSWFESDAVKATLAFDATADAVSVEEPPSALTMLWRAAQENSGLQAASGVLRGGSLQLVSMLDETAESSGVDIRLSAPVARILVRDSAVTGVALGSGEEIQASVVLSSLSAQRTYALLPPGEAGIGRALYSAPSCSIGAARIWLGLETGPDPDEVFSSASRFIIAERLESYAAAHQASRNRQIPDEVCFEAVGMPAGGRAFELSIVARPLPRDVEGGWHTAGVTLLARIVASLGNFDRSIKDRIRHARIFTPEELFGTYGQCAVPPNVARLLGPARSRVETMVEGLFLCGANAEPVSAISGRAARLATNLALAHCKQAARKAVA
jgi:phytoene dehydrogenase-like protein